ncbi:hypothetical protein A9A89_0008 [Bifidobacterium psychraerophilum DSM 22366]|nr:hypothetical protein A9A89_0004 [Bifidobacterium psychraerophilum DSM 22366]PKA93838.1 hypothetical protein A9A89_0008 [Bifidobacterium psychraerophilum DSM 22366]
MIATGVRITSGKRMNPIESSWNKSRHFRNDKQ